MGTGNQEFFMGWFIRLGETVKKKMHICDGKNDELYELSGRLFGIAKC